MLYYASPPLHLFHLSGDQERSNEGEVPRTMGRMGGAHDARLLMCSLL